MELIKKASLFLDGADKVCFIDFLSFQKYTQRKIKVLLLFSPAAPLVFCGLPGQLWSGQLPVKTGRERGYTLPPDRARVLLTDNRFRCGMWKNFTQLSQEVP